MREVATEERLPAVVLASEGGARARLINGLTAVLAIACTALAILSAILWWRILEWQEQIEPVERTREERQALASAVAQNPTDPLARIRLGIDLTRRRQTDAAAVQFTTADALAPGNPLAAFSLGRFYLHIGDNRRALPPLERAVSQDPRNADARLHLGLAHLHLDNPQAARREFEVAVRLSPSLAEAHLGLAMVLSDRATAKRALGEIDEYIRLATNPAIGRVLLSRSYFQQHEIPRAVQAARLAVQEESENPLAWQALGLALAEGAAAERDEAEACFRRTIALMPRFADAHIGLARVYLRQRKYAQAAESFETALALDPTAGYIQYELGQAYQGVGRADEAKEQFRRAAAYMEYKRQVVAARRAIVREPKNASLYVRLAKLYASHGAYDWAQPALERALRLKPGDSVVRREMRLVQEMARE